MLTKSLSYRTRLSATLNAQRSFSKHLKAFATIDPNHLTTDNKGANLVAGEWVGTNQYGTMVDPLTGKPMVQFPDTQMDEIDPFVQSLANTPKTGLHNPFKNKERYLMLGEVSRKVAEVMHDPEVMDFFVKAT
jgi:1-pyrroline-5-carboxylate dehydrogenase